MSFISCVNVKPAMHCVKIYLYKSVNECYPDFENMEFRKKFILKHKNRKLAKFPVKACDSRKHFYMRMRNVSSRVLLHTPTDRFVFSIYVPLYLLHNCKFNVAMFEVTY